MENSTNRVLSNEPKTSTDNKGAVIGCPKFIPILFSTSMVQAILRGDKTQTRRIIKPQPDDSGLWNDSLFPRSLDSTLKGWNGTVEATGESKEFNCKYGSVGNILWVRETFCDMQDHWLSAKEVESGRDVRFHYRADPGNDREEIIGWKPSLFMPKSACRIFLKVKSVRVERLQDISEADAIAEGAVHGRYHGLGQIGGSVREGYFELWERINGPGSVLSNPWVWVIEFERTERLAGFL